MHRKSICWAVAGLALLLAAPAAAQYGDGSDGAKNVTTPEASGYDAQLTGTYASGVSSMTLVAASTFSTGDEVVLVDLDGADAGNWEFITLSGANATTLSFSSATTNAYSDPRAVRVYQYSSFDVSGTGILSGTNGLLAIRSQAAVTIAGTVHVTEAGYRGGSSGIPGQDGDQGNSPLGGGSVSSAANGGGGGGGVGNVGAPPGGGGGGYGAAGTTGEDITGGSATPGVGGGTYGDAQLAQIFWGAGGGGGAASLLGGPSEGGHGGGILWLFAPEITVAPGGSIRADGGPGEDGVGSVTGAYAGGGGGAGGSIYLAAGSAGVINNGNVSAVGSPGGLGGVGAVTTGDGGTGGDGRIRVDGPMTGSGTFDPIAGFNGPALGPPPTAADGWATYE